jgi:hypothetical protein
MRCAHPGVSWEPDESSSIVDGVPREKKTESWWRLGSAPPWRPSTRLARKPSSTSPAGPPRYGPPARPLLLLPPSLPRDISTVISTPGPPQALGWLLSVPGASGSVLEVVVPYSRASMAHVLGKVHQHPNRPNPFCSTRRLVLVWTLVDWPCFDDVQLPLQFTSKQAAEDMALAAFNRALKLSGPGLWVPSLTSSWL